MNKEILEEKIAKLLKVSDEEKNLAFKIFKEKLSETLQISEAIRIENLGVFQLKEQLDHRSIGKTGEKSKSLTLVFSPDSEEALTNSLFLNLEIDKSKNDETEFNENVFQLGIGKPLIVDSDQKLESHEHTISDTEKIENEVAILFEKAEKLKNFDLWEDYLERKETTNILEEKEEPDLSIDSILAENGDDISELDIDSLDDEIIKENESEILDEIEEKNNLIADSDLNDIADEIGAEEINIPESLEESLETVIEENEEHFDEIDLEFDGELENEEEKNNRSFLEKIDEELAANEISSRPIDENLYEDELSEINDDNYMVQPSELSNGDKDELNSKIDIEGGESIIEDETNDENLKYEELDELNSDYEIENQNNLNEDEISDEDLQLEEVVGVEHKQPANKKSKSLFWILIFAFILIGAFGTYYLFFNSSPASYEAEEQLSVNEEPVNTVSDDDAKKVVEGEQKPLENNNDELLELPDSKESESIAKDSETGKEKLNAVDNDREVAKNIYFDGFVYNVQVSSWKQEKIAQKEVNKFVKGGFPAYKVRVYIPKFDGYWHRVRIGPFTSMQEAEETLKKVNK